MRDHNLSIWNTIDHLKPDRSIVARPEAAQPDRSEQQRRHDIIVSYSGMVERYVADGWKPYLLNFMFRSLPGSTPVVVGQMKQAIERVYSTFVTRVVRRPRSSAAKGSLPILISCADLPVGKRIKKASKEVRLNSGLHYNGVLLMPAISRLQSSVEAHFFEQQRLYVVDRKRIDRIDVRPIVTDAGHVTDYVMKTLKGGPIGYDESLLILPRSLSELPCR
jgi:hypothetical protein